MAEALPLIQTKLYRPPLQADLVHRPRLLDALNAHWKIRPLTLISAPAGYGKSVLASMWLENCDCPTGWVSLDETDNDLYSFTSYLLAAVKRAFPDISFQTQALLETETPLPAPMLARHLLNDLDQIDKPFVLVLDDVHLIHDKPILDLLTELLKHPPRTTHLVLIGRQDPAIPVASLRAYRLITEIRLNDLRFTPQETAELIEQVLHRDIDEELAIEWAEITEGWAAALHLAVLSLSYRRETADLKANFQGDSRYLQEYLLAEVLTHIPPDKQRWLLKTSLLDRFCAPLCEVVCQEEGETLTGPAFLSWLQTSNLLLIRLDDRGEWFRFHHLFQKHLQTQLERQLDDEGRAAHHQRASRWLAQNGWIDEAIQHALAAGDTVMAVGLVAQHRHRLMNEDRWNQLEKWLRLFPDEVVINDPILSITEVHLALIRGRNAVILSSRDQAVRLVAAMPVESSVAAEVRAEIALADAVIGITTGQAAEVVTKGNEALSLISQEAYRLRSIAVGAKAAGYQMLDHPDRGAQEIRRALSNPDWPEREKARLLLYRCIVAFMEGDLVSAQLASGEGLRLAKKNQLLATISHTQYFSGIVPYLWNDFANAEPHLLALTELPAAGVPNYLANATCALARIYHAQFRPEMASQIFQMTRSHCEELGHTQALAILRAFQVELALDQGDLALAQHLSQTVDFDSSFQIWFHFVPQLTPIKVLIAEKTAGSLAEALALLQQMDERLIKINRKNIRIDVLALQALVHAAQGDWEMASEKLSAALRQGAPGGFIRNFVDLGPPMADLLIRLQEQGGTKMDTYISQILAAFQMEEQGPIAPDLEKPLTMRELETLRLLATDLSTEEIASEMTISLGTMRTHARNIYQKLGVNSRFEAVQQAKESGLI